MTNINDDEYSEVVANTELTVPPKDHDSIEQERILRECGSHQCGRPHQDGDETEDERKNRLSDQRIELSRSRLLPDN